MSADRSNSGAPLPLAPAGELPAPPLLLEEYLQVGWLECALLSGHPEQEKISREGGLWEAREGWLQLAGRFHREELAELLALYSSWLREPGSLQVDELNLVWSAEGLRDAGGLRRVYLNPLEQADAMREWERERERLEEQEKQQQPAIPLIPVDNEAPAPEPWALPPFSRPRKRPPGSPPPFGPPEAQEGRKDPPYWVQPAWDRERDPRWVWNNPIHTGPGPEGDFWLDERGEIH